MSAGSLGFMWALTPLVAQQKGCWSWPGRTDRWSKKARSCDYSKLFSFQIKSVISTDISACEMLTNSSVLISPSSAQSALSAFPGLAVLVTAASLLGQQSTRKCGVFYGTPGLVMRTNDPHKISLSRVLLFSQTQTINETLHTQKHMTYIKNTLYILIYNILLYYIYIIQIVCNWYTFIFILF